MPKLSDIFVLLLIQATLAACSSSSDPTTKSKKNSVTICDADGICLIYSICAKDGDGDGVPAVGSKHYWLQKDSCPQTPGTFLTEVQTYNVSLEEPMSASVSGQPKVSAYFTDQVSNFLGAAYGAEDTNGDGNFDENEVNGEFDTTDCDDSVASTSPRKTEIFGNGVDDDCNGLTDEHKFMGNESIADGIVVGGLTKTQPLLIKINEQTQHNYLSNPSSNPTVQYEMMYFSYNNPSQVLTKTISQPTLGKYNTASRVLTLDSTNSFLPKQVYNIRIALKTASGEPLGESVTSAQTSANQAHLVYAGGSNNLTTLEAFRAIFLTKAFNERLAYLRGDVGRAGTEPNGSRYNTSIADDKWCDQLPRWVGQQSSMAVSGGVKSDFWANSGSKFIEDMFSDTFSDGECFKLAGAPSGCVGEKVSTGTCDCNQANLSSGYIDDDRDKAVDKKDASFIDDGKGTNAQYYYPADDLSPGMTIMDLALPGDLLHHTDGSHFGMMIGFDQTLSPGTVYSLDANLADDAIIIRQVTLSGSIREWPLDMDKREYWAEISQLSELTK